MGEIFRSFGATVQRVLGFYKHLAPLERNHICADWTHKHFAALRLKL